MTRPFFTVITTSHNRARLLREALESLKKQTFRDYEAFIFDDGSTDETQQMLESFKNCENWHFIRMEKNSGYPKCKNMAFAKAAGEYVTFLDSDDVWLPERLHEFHSYAVNHPERGFLFSNGFVLQDGVKFKMFEENRKIPEGKIPPYMAISNIWLPYVTTNVAIKMSVVNLTGKYNEEMLYLGDTEYFVRVLKNTECGVIRKPLSIYRIHPVSLTQSRDECIRESLLSLEAAEPPPEIYAKLHDFIYLSQAEVLLKNAFGKKAREYLKKTIKKNMKTAILYFFSFVPVPLIRIAKRLYKIHKRIRFRNT